MRKFSVFVTVMVGLSILLAACSPSTGMTSTSAVSGTSQAGTDKTETSGIPVTGAGTEAPKYPATTSESTSAATQMTNSTSEATTETTQMVDSTPVATTETTKMANSTPVETTQATQMAKTTSTAPATSPSTGMVDPGMLSNSIKFMVVDPQNQTLGQVQDFVLDFVNMKVAYVLVSLTPSSGTTANVVAVPWNQLKNQNSTVNTTNNSTTTTSTPTSGGMNAQNAFVYTGDAQLLAKAPVFAPASMPTLGSMAGTWDASIVSYWDKSSSAATPTADASAMTTATPAADATKSASASPLQGVVLASKVIGANLMDITDQLTAQITDLVVDVNSGALTYAVVTVNSKQVLVPLTFFGMNMQNQTFVLMGIVQALQAAPSFTMGSMPSTTTSGWDTQIQTYWQNMVQPTTTP